MHSEHKPGEVFGLLTNVEVMSVIESNQTRSKVRTSTQRHLLLDRDVIETRTMQYIKKNTPTGAHNMEAVKKCLSAIKKLGIGLTEAELLMIGNLVPRCEVEVYLIIDEIGERGLDTHVQAILDIVSEAFGLSAEGDESAEAGAEAGAEANAKMET